MVYSKPLPIPKSHGQQTVAIVLIAEGEPPENTHYVIIKDHDDQQCFDKLIIAANHSKTSYHTQIYHSPPWWTISSHGMGQPHFAELGLGSATAIVLVEGLTRLALVPSEFSVI